MLASSGQRPGMLSNFLQGSGPPPSHKELPSPKMSVASRLENTCLKQSYFKVWVHPHGGMPLSSHISAHRWGLGPVRLLNRQEKNEVQRREASGRTWPPVSNSSHFPYHFPAIFWELEINTDAFEDGWFLPGMEFHVEFFSLLLMIESKLNGADSGGREANHNSATSFLCTFHKRPLPEPQFPHL